MGKKRLEISKIEQIKNFRSRGYSLPEISREVEVPRTTVFRYKKE